MASSLSVLPSAGRLLVLLPLVLALFYTPLAFGGTTPNTVLISDALLASSFLFWCVFLLVKRRPPQIPSLILICVGVLAALGLCHAYNPKSVFFEDAWQLFEVATYVDGLPGTVDPATTLPLVRHFGALALAFFVLVDLLRDSKTRWFILRIVALSGFLIAVIGIVQRAGGADSMLWVDPERSGKTFFGAFRYNANAGAFLNLSWPAALAIWLRSRAQSEEGRGNPIDFVIFFFLSAAIFTNTSKAGQILGLVGIVSAIIWFWPIIKPSNTSPLVITILSLVFLSILSISVIPALTLIFARWEVVAGSLEGRLILYEVSGKMIADSGIYGQGPGAFRVLFPFYTEYLGDRLKGRFTHAHQDYLQTIIEWGYLGFAAWAVFIGTGFLAAMRRAIRMRKNARLDLSVSCAALALTMTLLHACADFPLQIPAIQLLTMLQLSICWTAFQSGRKHERQQSGNR